MGVRCFMLEDLSFERLWLRRYADGPCPSMPASEYSYHQAMVPYRDRAPAEKRPDERYGMTIHFLEPAPPDDDPRWPTHCECGFEFPAGTCHQLFSRQIYKRRDTGEEILLEDAPAGAMWDCWWISDHKRVSPEAGAPGSYVGPDGLSLSVKTPGGEWLIDGPAYSEDGERMTGGWTRTGAPPDVTARPSIRIMGGKGKPDKYHGWLTAGVLVPC